MVNWLKDWRIVWMLKIRLGHAEGYLNRYCHTDNPMYVVWAIEEMNLALQGITIGQLNKKG